MLLAPERTSNPICAPTLGIGWLQAVARPNHLQRTSNWKTMVLQLHHYRTRSTFPEIKVVHMNFKTDALERDLNA